MKTILFSVATAVLASGVAIALSYAFGARGDVFSIIAAATALVSCTTAFAAAGLGVLLRKKKEALG